jgi:flagellar hook-associated protein 3 FlgL
MNIFAGTSDASTAFNSDYSYNGTPGASVQRRVGPDTTIPVSADGSAVFGTGSSSVFALIDTITSNLSSGTSISSQLDSINSFLTNVEGVEASVGASQQQLQQAQTALQTQATTIQSNQSSVENADPAQVILEMQTQQVAYQTALAVTAQSLQSTLMNYLEQ